LQQLHAEKARPDRGDDHGLPAEELLEAAADTDADMIVVGARGTGGFKKLLLGSVSSHLAHHAHCPVVIVPS
jgi:nucleotide-binding universal stress UspA family protein